MTSRGGVAPTESSDSADPAPVDLHLVFPPQWSPFQPFLSTPALKSYLGARGHNVAQSDWNVRFYHYFISKDRLSGAHSRLERYLRILTSEHEDYRTRAIFAAAILEDYDRLSSLCAELRDPRVLGDLGHFKECVDAFQLLLDAFSVAEPVIDLRTSSLGTADVMRDADSMHAFVADEAENPFAAFFQLELQRVTVRPRYFGISVIGIEQLLPALTLCLKIRDRFRDTPILIGGSVLSRMVEKDPETAQLFERYFDFVCRYEGERPMDALLSSSNPRRDRTPNLAFLADGKLELTPLCEPLVMSETPTPDFDDLPLDLYYSPHVVLPLLTTRGCYWGKCAFCYHGMIYQDRYRMREPSRIAEDVDTLNARYGARHFAFNDEAIPPKLFRRLPEVIPPGKYFFTGLYKFETYFRDEDYERMFQAGFRSLYIGLESASERLQRHMRKNNLQSTMLANLRGAHDAGIWNHTFAFFGFPTETEEEAAETERFLIENAEIIHSEGTGTFSLEHNAPIYNDPAAFGLRSLEAIPNRVLELYYDYEVESGMDAQAAQKALRHFTDEKRRRSVHQLGRWIPREHLLILLSVFSREALRTALQGAEGVRHYERVRQTFSWTSLRDSGVSPRHYVVNRATRQMFETNDDTVAVLSLLGDEMTVGQLVSEFPALGDMLR